MECEIGTSCEGVVEEEGTGERRVGGSLCTNVKENDLRNFSTLFKHNFCFKFCVLERDI
jgi:hypothetical protein